MTIWLVLVFIAQLLNAGVAIVDKYLVTSPKAVSRPFVYTFYISILSSLSVVVFLFSWIRIPIESIDVPSFANIGWLSLDVGVLAFVHSLAFFLGLLFMFRSLKRADASDVVPVVGAVSAAFVFLLSNHFFGTELAHNFFIGFILLLLGTLLVSHFRFSMATFAFSTFSGIGFAVASVSFKGLTHITHFDNAFFWTRMFIVIVALVALIWPKNYYRLTHQTKKHGRKSKMWYWILGNKAIAGLASIMVLKAIQLGPVSIVEALGGLRFLFLVTFSALLGKKTPYEYGENVNLRELVQKTVFVSMISLGFFLLFI